MLPTIDANRLRRIVSDVEMDSEIESFEHLCKEVSATIWAKSSKLNADEIGKLIIKHKIPVQVNASTDKKVDAQEKSQSEVVEEKVIKTYDEGGHGRKQCQACKKYVGVRIPVCPCGHKIQKAVPKPVEEKVIKTYDEGGIGRKQCQACKKYVGLRIAVCPCGHTIQKSEPKPIEEKVIKTYDEGGLGRKQCQACHKYVGVRVPVCACGHVIEKSNPTHKHQEKETQTFSKGGKGKKFCPKCQKYTGIRASVCACGHQFPVKEETPKIPQFVRPMIQSNVNQVFAPDPLFEEPNGRPVSGGYRMRIHIPAGNCPHRLNSIDNESVFAWANQCRDTFKNKDNSLLTRNALKFFVRQFFPIFSEEHNSVCSYLENFSD